MKSNIVLALARSAPIDIVGTVDNFIPHLYIHGGLAPAKANRSLEPFSRLNGF
jgi:hypothetical protein